MSSERIGNDEMVIDMVWLLIVLFAFVKHNFKVLNEHDFNILIVFIKIVVFCIICLKNYYFISKITIVFY